MCSAPWQRRMTTRPPCRASAMRARQAQRRSMCRSATRRRGARRMTSASTSWCLVGSFDRDGWLDAAERRPTRRVCPLVEGPTAIVWHTTDTVRANLEKMLERVGNLPTPGQRQASWHLLIARDGTIYQSAPICVGTWHVVGRGVIGGRRQAVNLCTVGIEVENAGRLKLTDRGYFAYPVYRDGDPAQGFDLSLRVESDEAVKVPGLGYWHAFTREQEVAAAGLIAALHTALPKLDEREMSRTHREFDPDRREDPGPLWADSILPRLVGVALRGTP